MKRIFGILGIILSCPLAAQSSGTMYSMKLGTASIPFIYQEKIVTEQVRTDSLHRTDFVTEINPLTLEENTYPVKDTLVTKKVLTPPQNRLKTIHTRHAAITDIKIIAYEGSRENDTIVTPHYEVKYHFDAIMKYDEFVSTLKAGFPISNTEGIFHVHSFELFYETRDTSGQAEAKYPLTEDPERVLGNLTQGGLVLLKLYGTDHKGINISVDDDFLAAIRIQK